MNVWKTILSESQIAVCSEGAGVRIPSEQPSIRCLLTLIGDAEADAPSFMLKVGVGESEFDLRSVTSAVRPLPRAYGFQDFSDGTWVLTSAQMRRGGLFQVSIRYRAAKHLMVLRGQCRVCDESIRLGYFRCSATIQRPGGIEEYLQFLSSALADRDIREAFPEAV